MELDSKPISDLPVETYYILDASAVFHEPDIRAYSKDYKNIESSAAFILTTAFLREIDNTKYKHKHVHTNHNSFMQVLRDALKIGKLSKGVKIDNGDLYIIFFPDNLEKFKDEDFDFLPHKYPDRQLLTFAKMLKGKDINVSIISRDGLMGVLCRENSIGYIYLDEKDVTKDKEKEMEKPNFNIIEDEVSTYNTMPNTVKAEEMTRLAKSNKLRA